jgi:hypothetical protein
MLPRRRLTATAQHAGATRLRLYANLRREFIAHPIIRNDPRFVSTCRDLTQFRRLIQSKSPNFRGRREHPRLVPPALDALEGPGRRLRIRADEVLATSTPRVSTVWQRARPPEGRPRGAHAGAHALRASARTSSTTRHRVRRERRPTEALPPGQPALQLAPSQHTEADFKRILGGCTSVVEGLGGLRNRLGDAHGKGKKQVKPSSRHAELAVNLAGAMAVFLVETWSARRAAQNDPRR